MISVAVSMTHKSRIHFVQPGVKINSDYYRNHLLAKGLLPDIKDASRHLPTGYVFQQDGAPSHTARATVALLTAEA